MALGREVVASTGLESLAVLNHIGCRELGFGRASPWGCIKTPPGEEFDMKPLLPHVTTPVLVISGRHDTVLPPRFQADIVDNLKNSHVTWRIFELSGHMVFQEQPRASAEAILDFLGIPHPQRPQRTGRDGL